MSQMPDKVWLPKHAKYNTSDFDIAYLWEFAERIEDEGIENFVEYVNKDTFLDKACEYIRNHIDPQLTIYHEQTWCKRDEFIKNFRQAMEE